MLGRPRLRSYHGLARIELCSPNLKRTRLQTPKSEVSSLHPGCLSRCGDPSELQLLQDIRCALSSLCSARSKSCSFERVRVYGLKCAKREKGMLAAYTHGLSLVLGLLGTDVFSSRSQPSRLAAALPLLFARGFEPKRRHAAQGHQFLV